MAKTLKWLGIGLGTILTLLILAALILFFIGTARLNKTRSVPTGSIPIQTDPVTLQRGQHLVSAICTSCHGEDLSGQAMLDDPAIGTIYTANITGLGATRSDADLLRAIRHGVAPDGRQLFIMPAEVFIHFSAEDLGAIIAYLKTVPRVDEERPKPQLAPMGRILLALGMFGQVFPAEYIDHSQPFPTMPQIGANAEYGEYISGLCASCHGANLSGAQPGDPNSPPAPDLTPGGELMAWSESDFIQTLRTGVTPSGHTLNEEFMPWQAIGKLDDDELSGIWMYLNSLPASSPNAQ
jgi:mono/diheme cytochrome c family protein